MTAKIVNLSLNKGDTGKYKLKIVNQDGIEVVLGSDDMLYMTIKNNYDDSEYLFQKNSENGIEYSDGYHHIVIQPEDTDNLNFMNYVYDILLVRNAKRSDTDKEKITLIRGNFNIDYTSTHANNEL